MILVPDDNIRKFINVNKGVVRHNMDRVFVFVNNNFLGTVKNSSLEKVFSTIYDISTIKILKVNIQEMKNINEYTLIIKAEMSV